MYESAYDIVALGMRYFFIVVICYILLRLILHSITEFKAVQQIKQQVRGISPGYLEVLAPKELCGEKYSLRRENTVGRGKRCDISIQHASLAQLHAFIYEKRKGLYLADYGSRAGVLLNDTTVKKREELLYTQDKITLGDVVLKLHLVGEAVEEEDGRET